MSGRGRPMSEETKRKNEALALYERYENGDVVDATYVETMIQQRITQMQNAGALTTDAQSPLNVVLETGFATDKFRSVMQDEGKKLLQVFRNDVERMEQRLTRVKKNTLYVETANKQIEVTDMVHEKFETLLRLVSIGIPAMLVGPAGSVKTTTAKVVAQTLEIPHYVQSVSAQTTKSDLFGFVTANGVYVPSAFRLAYESGGVFVLDEIDAGNANVLVLLNGAVSGDDALFPDNKTVSKHEDFKMIVTANTFGQGAKRDFVGRNQLDAATLDRFAIIEWNIDEKLEWSFVDGYQYGDAWFQTVCKLRQKVYAEQILMQVSPRMTIRGAQMLEIGMSIDEVINICVGNVAPEQRKQQLVAFVLQEWHRV